MKRLQMFGVCFCLFLMVAGCSLNKAFVNAVDDSWSAIGPEYQTYVRADSMLTQADKDIRICHAESLTKLIEEARAQQ